MHKSIRTKEYKDFSDKLRKARLAAGLTQVEVAKKLKKSQSFVSKCEAGEQRLDIIELKEFLKLYKKEVGHFLN